jgi:hypothetical protein
MQPQTKIEVDSRSNPACHAPVRRSVGHLIAFDIDGAIGATHMPLAIASSLSDRGETGLPASASRRQPWAVCRKK